MYIIENLNPMFELRPYQQNAFRNFITYYEGDDVARPLQLLFHMATGSGKTLVMSGLILYLYKHGYRNFMFFVSSRNILIKTKSNFFVIFCLLLNENAVYYHTCERKNNLFPGSESWQIH